MSRADRDDTRRNQPLAGAHAVTLFPPAILLAVGLIVFGHAGRAAGQQNSEDPCGPGWALGAVRVALGGQYRLMANAASFDFHSRAVPADPAATSLANQRFRTWLNVADAERCRYGAYLQAEVGHVRLGDGFEFPKTFTADGDEVGVELRRGYLWFKPTDQSLIRAGVLDWQDRFGERSTFVAPLWAVDRYDTSRAPLANSVWDFNVAGVVFEATARERWHYSGGLLVLQHGDTSIGGDGGSLLFTADVDRELGSTLWGASVYYLDDRGGYSYGAFGGPIGRGPIGDDSWDLWVGGRGHFQLGAAPSSVFLIVNTGQVDAPRWEHTGWAAKFATDLPLGPGTLELQALYSTGNDGTSAVSSGEFRTVAQSARDNLGAQSYWSLLGLTSPRGPSDTNDLGIGLQNDGLGLLTLQAGWSQLLSEGWTAYAAAGWLRSAEKNPASLASTIGTELLGELHWQMASMLSLDVGGSLLLTGDFYKPRPGAPSPGTLYEVYARWQLEL